MHHCNGTCDMVITSGFPNTEKDICYMTFGVMQGLERIADDTSTAWTCLIFLAPRAWLRDIS